MASATSENVMVRRDDARTYYVVDADTKAILAGPFDRASYAAGVAYSLALKRGGSVLNGLHVEIDLLASKLQEVRGRVDELTFQCRVRARQLAEAIDRTETDSERWRTETLE